MLDYKEFSTFLKGVFHSNSLADIPEEKLKKFMLSLDSNKVLHNVSNYPCNHYNWLFSIKCLNFKHTLFINISHRRTLQK